VRVEGTLGYMLSNYQQVNLSQGIALHGAIRPGVQLVGPLAFQIAIDSAIFPANGHTGYQWLVGAGLRAEPEIARVGRLVVDCNAGVGFTGAYSRFALNAGGAFEFQIASFLSAGPMVRYHHLFATEGDISGSAMYLTGGASITLRAPPAPPLELPPPPRDRDGDGVLDESDLCVNTPAGPTPDPQRPGCALGDSDGDGVNDRDDLCASTAAGPHPDPNRRGCPDGDDDNDRVLNSRDQCRTQHHGLHPDPQRPGCPAPDGDNDSVPDVSDACPSQPGQPHPDRARNGCPGMVLVENGQIRTMEPIFFELRSDRILPQSERVLQAMADALTASPEIRRLGVHGHTDDLGEDDFNLDLSRRRAQAVSDWLTRHGVAAARLDVQGFGEARPLVASQTEQARAVNRRVEFRILEAVAAGDESGM
jgi:outer membrane protein OmpA-like peptidoglycan-associated protein